MEFEWDTNKEKSNVKKHGVTFVAAAKLLASPHYEARSDRHSEIRHLAVGALDHKMLAVVYTKRENRYRIISARRASKNEEKAYRENRKI